MRCHRVQKVLPDYVGDELSAKKRGRVEQHLEACPDCRADLTALQGVWAGLVRQPLPQKGEEFWGTFTRGVMREIRKKRLMPAEEKSPLSFPGWKLLLPAAGAAAVIIVGVIALKGSLGPVGRGTWTAQDEQEALVEVTSDLSVGPLATVEEDPLGQEMTFQEVSLVADDLGISLQPEEMATISTVLTQQFEEEDLYGQLEDLTGEELDDFYQLLSLKYPYS
jgi:anti-sigma factor RsiW